MKQLLTRTGVAALTMTLACGGGGGPSAPSPPGNPGGQQPNAAACGAIGSSGVPATTSIVNGAQCVTTTSSVILVSARDRNGQPLGACSGTIIAPRAVLTAAHCIDGDTAQVSIFLGSGEPIVARSFEFNPSYQSTQNTGADVAVVFFGDDIGRAPIAVLTSRDPRVGESVVLAGLGRDLFGVGTTLRAGTTTISAVRSDTIETQFSASTSAVCSGDSGGALLVSEGGVWAVAGVTSAVSASGCLQGTNFFANVRSGANAAFIFDRVPDAARR